MSAKENYREIREAVAKLCARFPGEYWRDLDRRMAYPREFVAALTGGRVAVGSDPGGIWRGGPAALRRGSGA